MGSIGWSYFNRWVIVVVPIETFLLHWRLLVEVARADEVTRHHPGSLCTWLERSTWLSLLYYSIFHYCVSSFLFLDMRVPAHHFRAVCLRMSLLEPLLGVESLLSCVEGSFIYVDLFYILYVSFYSVCHLPDIVSLYVVERDVFALKLEWGVVKSIFWGWIEGG